MNNSDMPAMPIGEQIDGMHLNPNCNGLTKREDFAIKLMAGMAAGREYDGAAWKVMAGEAITGADALLLALESSK